MPFGRFKGWPLDELPDPYLRWLYGLDDLREPLRSEVDREWHRRFTEPPVAIAYLPPEAVPIANELVTAGLRALTRRHHPDAGGDHQSMVMVNTAARWLREAVRSVA